MANSSSNFNIRYTGEDGPVTIKEAVERLEEYFINHKIEDEERQINFLKSIFCGTTRTDYHNLVEDTAGEGGREFEKFEDAKKLVIAHFGPRSIEDMQASGEALPPTKPMKYDEKVVSFIGRLSKARRTALKIPVGKEMTALQKDQLITAVKQDFLEKCIPEISSKFTEDDRCVDSILKLKEIAAKHEFRARDAIAAKIKAKATFKPAVHEIAEDSEEEEKEENLEGLSAKDLAKIVEKTAAKIMDINNMKAKEKKEKDKKARNDKSHITCFKCGKKGHYQRDCRSRGQPQNRNFRQQGQFQQQGNQRYGQAYNNNLDIVGQMQSFLGQLAANQQQQQQPSSTVFL